VTDGTAPIRVLIADDEPPARRKLRRFLTRVPDIEVVGEAADGDQAASLIRSHRPDAVFLDVQMPSMDGFAVLDALSPHLLPVVVFVTAHDEYAVRAFEVRALDYLLKPYDERRFRAAVDRMRAHVRAGRQGDLAAQLRGLIADVHGRSRFAHRLMVSSHGTVSFVKTDEIAWIEGAANYVKLHVGRDIHTLRETLDGLLARLDPATFVRVHRSSVVNVDHIRRLYHWSHGDYMIELKDGGEVRMSRRYRELFGRPA
jgi:two-component system LytT family response regulator